MIRRAASPLEAVRQRNTIGGIGDRRPLVVTHERAIYRATAPERSRLPGKPAKLHSERSDLPSRRLCRDQGSAGVTVGCAA